MGTLFEAMQIAGRSGYFVVRTKVPRRIVIRPWDVLHVGPRADKDEVATIGVRLALLKRGTFNEALVKATVERKGFRYVPARRGLLLLKQSKPQQREIALGSVGRQKI